MHILKVLGVGGVAKNRRSGRYLLPKCYQILQRAKAADREGSASCSLFLLPLWEQG
jgi:hypothetical protein